MTERFNSAFCDTCFGASRAVGASGPHTPARYLQNNERRWVSLHCSENTSARGILGHRPVWTNGMERSL